MKHLTKKCLAAVQLLNSHQRSLVREIYRGHEDWGTEESFLEMVEAVKDLSLPELTKSIHVFRDANITIGNIVCPDGRC